MEPPAPEYTFKVLLVGDSSVGKTSLISRFIDDTFAQSYTATVGIDNKSKLIDVDGFKVKLQIWDTAGQERFRTITTAYYRGAQGIALVYDITRPNTFRNASYWMSSIDEHAPPNAKKVLIANKVDLYPDREVSTSEGQAQANGYDMQYFEVSAKTGEGVTEAFMALAQELMESATRQEMRRAVAGHRQDSGNIKLNNDVKKGRKESCCK
jgi:small GTP-binding protein